MAATTKTLTPTNQTISIPAFTDKPDNRLQTDSTSKLADAVNALNSNKANKGVIRLASNSSVSITVDNYDTAMIIFLATNNTNTALYVFSNGYLAPVKSAENVTVTLSSNYKTITITNDTGTAFHVGCISAGYLPVFSYVFAKISFAITYMSDGSSALTAR